MFLFHTEEYLRLLEQERERSERRNQLLRERSERRNQLLRELRGVTPPFGEALTRRLAAALAKTPRPTPYAGRERRRDATPCPELKEPMTS